MVSPSNQARTARNSVVFCLLLLASVQAVWAAGVFTPQRRVGYTTGDQWEPAMAADGHGHVYILYPQYGAVPDCANCTVPTIALLISDDNGMTWQAVVDPVDRQTVYASWLQNKKRDIVVARSIDFGRTWSMSVAERGEEDADKPVLAVRGRDVYVGFNHEEEFFVAASHDYGELFNRVEVNSGAEEGASLAGGATVDPNGTVYFGWTAYARHDMSNHSVNIYVSRSVDGGKTWGTSLLDVSGAPPDCEAQACETGYLGAQVALASDAAGTVYALWNAGRTNGGPERIYFSSSTADGTGWSLKANVSAAGDGVESCFPAIVAGAAGDIRIAWMDARMSEASLDPKISDPKIRNQPVWNTFYRGSTNGGATWSAETQLSGQGSGAAPEGDYVLPNGFRFPFGDYFTIAIDNQGTTHAVWGEGLNYKSPGSIWYTHGR
ncbi:MAG: sialidase family protein [Candidatus Sulfotelmatobacter sp.]